MPTVDKDIAEAKIAECKAQKKPAVYCIVRYQNRLNGDSEKMVYGSYMICYRPHHYQSLMRNDFVGGVDVLWKSAEFEADQINNMDEDELEDYLCSDKFLDTIRKADAAGDAIQGNVGKARKRRKKVRLR